MLEKKINADNVNIPKWDVIVLPKYTLFNTITPRYMLSTLRVWPTWEASHTQNTFFHRRRQPNVWETEKEYKKYSHLCFSWNERNRFRDKKIPNIEVFKHIDWKFPFLVKTCRIEVSLFWLEKWNVGEDGSKFLSYRSFQNWYRWLKFCIFITIWHKVMMFSLWYFF